MKGVFCVRPVSIYDDLPEERYQFPERYLNVAKQTIGDWILYYEPRREGGRLVYFAVARVKGIIQDTSRSGMYVAQISDYLDFTIPVPFKVNDQYPESALIKEDGSFNKGVAGWAMRILPEREFTHILKLGFQDSIMAIDNKYDNLQVAEEEVEYNRNASKELVERTFREKKFSKLIQHAYDSTCAMTGLKIINGGGRCEIEAAHIIPVEQFGPDSVRNGVALSRTVHWLFDRGILSIAGSGEILMAKKLVPPLIQKILNQDQYATLPDDPSLRPHPKFLEYHREHIYKGD